MNVFVLSTGRCGTTTFAKACKAMTNFTAAHESERRRDYGNFVDRYQTLEYPKNHIEVDNRLSWFLGHLDEIYGKDAFYVHLLREREEVAVSHLNRWKQRKTNIIFSFAWGVLTHPYELIEKLSDEDRLIIGRQYWDTVNKNIRSFLKDKPLQCTLRLDDIRDGFESFWHRIGAEGDMHRALATWNTAYNKGIRSSAGVADRQELPLSSKSPSMAKLLNMIGVDHICIVVDDSMSAPATFENAHVLPFTEQDGQYWGRPEDDEHAIAELERLREVGAKYIAFISHSLWWLEYFVGLREYLDSNYILTLGEEDLIVYDLRSEK